MSKTLKDFFGNDKFDQAWLWCDIDGHGPQWKLVIPHKDEYCGEDKEESPMI